MGSTDLSARIRYLNDSAHLLAISAPSYSAYLMSRCNNLLLDNGIEQTDAHRQHVCSACGNIMILGWKAILQFESVKSQKRRRGGQHKKTGTPDIPPQKSMVYNCDLCRRKTRLNIPPPPPRNARNTKLDGLHGASNISTPSNRSALATETGATLSANASSRKRAKARKEGGLQALLAKRKETISNGTTNGFGLDLMDLMRKD